jgi:hypothetical protein
MAVGPPVADSEDEVGFEHGRVAVAMRRLQSDHASRQPVIVWNAAPAHERRHHRHIEDLCQFDQQVRSVGVDDAAARDQERSLGGDEHVDRLLRLCSRGGRLVHGQWLIRLRVEIDFGQLDVDGQINQHRPGPPRPHQVKRLRESAWNLARFEHRHRHLGDRCGDGCDVDRLKVLFMESGDWCLAGNGEDRNGIR